MAEIVNLNKFRKRRAKEMLVKQAETNRRLHGRTKGERAREALEKAKLARSVDNARLGAVSEEDPAGPKPTS